MPKCLRAISGIDDRGHHELELEELVCRSGGAGKDEGIRCDAEVRRDVAASKNFREVVAGVFAKAAAGEEGACQGIEEGHVLRLRELACADAGEHPDAVALEGGGLEVDADVVVQGDLSDAEIFDFNRGRDFPGTSKLSVAELHGVPCRGRLHGDVR